MMTAVLVLAMTPFCLAAENSVKGLLGVAFGQICTIKAEFIDKPNDYYAQNVSGAKYYLKIIEINGSKLSHPLIVEPGNLNFKAEKYKIYSLRAFEIIQSVGTPKGWTDEAQQFDYHIQHKIEIQSP
jgi:hypothetical protein